MYFVLEHTSDSLVAHDASRMLFNELTATTDRNRCSYLAYRLIINPYRCIPGLPPEILHLMVIVAYIS